MIQASPGLRIVRGDMHDALTIQAERKRGWPATGNDCSDGRYSAFAASRRAHSRCQAK